MKPNNVLLDVGEAAQHLGISRATLYKLMASGEIATVHIGRRVFISQAVIDNFIADREAEGVEYAAQLRRRREAADRLPPLTNGKRDPWAKR